MAQLIVYRFESIKIQVDKSRTVRLARIDQCHVSLRRNQVKHTSPIWNAGQRVHMGKALESLLAGLQSRFGELALSDVATDDNQTAAGTVWVEGRSLDHLPRIDSPILPHERLLDRSGRSVLPSQCISLEVVGETVRKFG